MPSARRVAWAKLRVAATTVSATAIVTTLVYLLTSGLLFTGKATVFLFMPDAGGLDAGSPVRVDGVGVGKVTAVAFSGSHDPNRIVKATMAIESPHLSQIPSDSFVQLTADTLVGDQFVDITSGASPRPVAARGELAFKPQPELLKTLDIPQFEARMRVIDALLTDIEQGRGRVGRFVVGEQVYADLRKRLTEVDRGLHAVGEARGWFSQLIYTNALERKVLDPLERFEAALERLQTGQGAGGKFLRDDAQFEQLRHSVAGLGDSVAKWRSGELAASDQAYLEWNRRLATLIRAVDDFNAGPAFSSSLDYDNLVGSAQELAAALKDFRENPKKFLRMKLF